MPEQIEQWASEANIRVWVETDLTLYEMTDANKVITGWQPTRLAMLDKLRGLGLAAKYDHGAHRKP